MLIGRPKNPGSKPPRLAAVGQRWCCRHRSREGEVLLIATGDDAIEVQKNLGMSETNQGQARCMYSTNGKVCLHVSPL